MYGNLTTAALLGVDAIGVDVEARISTGLPSFTIVGLAAADARTCRERVRCGIASVGVSFPLGRIVVNLAPADIPKRGAGVDLPIALALLAASGTVDMRSIAGVAAHGEIGLDGCLRPVPGVLAAAQAARRRGCRALLVDEASAARAAGCGIPVIGLASMAAALEALKADDLTAIAASPTSVDVGASPDAADFADVRGQDHAVRAALIAAAGQHNLLLFGPPGCGKTMIASRMPGILSPLTESEQLEVRQLHDAAGHGAPSGASRPFRAPHHTATQTALVGGGSQTVHVGEITLAHRGILFLDELPEFRPTVLDALRQPLESGAVRVRRAGWAVRLPARCQLVAAMNLCRCGRTGTRSGEVCRCAPHAVEAYRARVSGAILDRFDIAVRLEEPDRALAELEPGVSSARLRQQVVAVQNGRQPIPGLDGSAQAALDQATISLGVSGRSQAAVARVAATIARLDGAAAVSDDHLLEALSLRPLLPDPVAA